MVTKMQRKKQKNSLWQEIVEEVKREFVEGDFDIKMSQTFKKRYAKCPALLPLDVTTNFYCIYNMTEEEALEKWARQGMIELELTLYYQELKKKLEELQRTRWYIS